MEKSNVKKRGLRPLAEADLRVVVGGGDKDPAGVTSGPSGGTADRPPLVPITFPD
jgi:hypothetical protein